MSRSKRGRRKGEGKDAGAAPDPGAKPEDEMALSESMANWLQRGDSDSQADVDEDGTTTRFDPRASGRRREIVVVGGALLVALGLVWVLRSHAPQNEAAPAPAAVARTASAADLVVRADQALAAGKNDEATELARQALALEASAADAYVIIGEAQQKAGKTEEARATYRKYLELAPFGKLAERARARMADLGDKPAP